MFISSCNLQIKFSHQYPKLWAQTKAELVAIKILDAREVQQNQALILYDTMYNTEEGDAGYYELPQKGKLLQLIFIGDLNIPFCTLRAHTDEKEAFYRKHLNEYFEVAKSFV